jgi:hypothetical protein
MLMLLASGILLVGCSGSFSTPVEEGGILAENRPTGRITPTPFQPLLATETATPTAEPSALPTSLPTQTSSPLPASPPPSTPSPGVPAGGYLPGQLRAGLQLPAGIEWSHEATNPLLRLEVGEQRPLARWVYALSAPFPTVVDEVSAGDIRRSWQGDPRGPFGELPLLLDESTLGVFSAMWGPPASGAVEILPEDELLGYAWEHSPSWALLPFEALEPRWKVLAVDGQSPLHKDFNPDDYPLAVMFSAAGDPAQVEAFLALNLTEEGALLSNRQPDKLTTLAMTGVTALVRATAWTMERNGIAYPAQDIGGLLSQADITHVSNEIPFDASCPAPNPSQPDLRFCSDPDYIELMAAIGTDVVELTGDHFADRGPEAMRYTLELYEQAGWTYYGGGYDHQDARQPRLLEHNGNKLAFIGCNGKGGGYATASETEPGAVACDFDWMHRQIANLRDDGYQVIATFQHFEYYSYYPQPLQVTDFGGMAQAGAVIVSGSQSHQPQGMAFDGRSFIHYGLGNLFFDQYQFCTDNACDDGFVDRHVFYDGRYIGTELLTIRFVDYARPRLMTPDERAELLDKVFTASGW